MRLVVVCVLVAACGGTPTTLDGIEGPWLKASVKMRGQGAAVILFFAGATRQFPDCPVLDEQVVATFGGQPMVLTMAGGPGEDACNPLQFTMAGELTPTSGEVILSDRTLTIEARFEDAAAAPRDVTHPSWHFTRGTQAMVTWSPGSDLAAGLSTLTLAGTELPPIIIGDQVAFTVPATVPVGMATLAIGVKGGPPDDALSCTHATNCTITQERFGQHAVTIE